MKKFICLLLALVFILSFAACEKETDSSEVKATEKKVEKKEETKTTQTPIAEDEPMVISWLGLPLTTASGRLFPASDCYPALVINEILNIELQTVETQFDDQTQMNLLFASGEIPDVMLCYKNILEIIIEEGLGGEIPMSAFKSMSPTVHSYLETNIPNWKNSIAYAGDFLHAVPHGIPQAEHLMVVRTDWLSATGASMPTNLEEFKEVCRVFTEDDPDGDGVANTFGFNISANTMGYDLKFISHAFGFELYGWELDEAGSIISSNISDNYKDMLLYLQDLYSLGYIDPDVTANKAETANAKFTDGIVGFKTNSWTRFMADYRPTDWYALTFQKNSEATTDYVTPFNDAQGNPTAVYPNSDTPFSAKIWAYIAPSMNVDDAKLDKILQILELQLTDMEVFNAVWFGEEGEHYTLNDVGMAIPTEDWSSAEAKAELGVKYFLINAKDTERMNISFGNTYEKLVNMQSTWKFAKPLISRTVSIDAAKEYGADVSKIVEQFMFTAITGSDFDIEKKWAKYTEDWLNAGGKEITEEAQAVYSK